MVSALGAAFGNLFKVGYVAAIPNVVELGRANGSLQALVYVLGPLTAGALATRLGVATTLVFDAASFGISALTLSLVRSCREGGGDREGRDAPGEAENGPTGLSPGALLAGVRLLLRQRVLRTALALAAVVAAVGAPRLLRARRDDGADGSGGGGGGAHGGGGGVLLGTGIQALGLLVAASVRGVGTTAFGAGLWAMGLTVRAVPYQGLRQALTPDPLFGRVTAASMTITFASPARARLSSPDWTPPSEPRAPSCGWPRRSRPWWWQASSPRSVGNSGGPLLIPQRCSLTRSADRPATLGVR